MSPQPNEDFVDCTAGEGGHTEAILERNGPLGRVLAIEWDPELFSVLLEKSKKEKRIVPVNDSYTLIEEIAVRKGFSSVSGILFDLGFSSFHVDRSGRGFSFMRKEPLDMRYNKNNPLTAYDIVNKYKEKDIEYILKKWGDEKYAKEIAHKIVLERREDPIETTTRLAEIVKRVIPERHKENLKIHCATRTFQALRIAVNGELMGIESALPDAFKILKKEGRMVIICFHEGEERVVKKFLRSHKKNIKLLTKDPVVPTIAETNKNIRSRSAKLYSLMKK